MKTIEEMRNLEVEIAKYLAENRIFAGVWAENELVMKVEIDWGDWKHEHLRCNWLMKEWAEKTGRHIVVGGEDVTEEDGSDTYSSIHKYAIVG